MSFRICFQMWLGRHRHFLDVAVGNLWRRKVRFLTTTGLYVLVVFWTASVLFTAGALRREAARLMEHAPELSLRRVVAGHFSPVPSSWADAVAGIRGVTSARPRAWGYYTDPFSGAVFTLLVAPERHLADGDAVTGEAVERTFGAARAGRLHVTTHDRRGRLLSIVERYSSKSALLTADLILLNDATFRDITGLPAGTATDIAVSVANPAELPVIARKLDLAFPDSRTLTRRDMAAAYDAAFDWRTGAGLLFFWGAIAAFLLFALIRAGAPDSGERAETGLLKALGWNAADILALRLWEGLTVSLTAFLAGIAAARIHVAVLGAPLLEPLFKGWAVVYPRFPLSGAVTVDEVASLALITVAPYTLLGLIPAWQSAVAAPESLMRGE